jgi:shikimate 5-dehydrogenase
VTAADDVSDRTGSTNTIRRNGDGWEVRNFDVEGFLSPLSYREGELRDRRAVVVGAGGAARTAGWALQSVGARVEVAARRDAQARKLAGEFEVAVASWPPAPGWDLLVNTTPVGTWPDVESIPIAPDAVHGRVVYDLIYNPEETALLKAARANGVEVIGGLDMLVGQACLQFEWWTGRLAPRRAMLAAARRFLATKQVEG